MKQAFPNIESDLKNLQHSTSKLIKIAAKHQVITTIAHKTLEQSLATIRTEADVKYKQDLRTRATLVIHKVVDAYMRVINVANKISSPQASALAKHILFSFQSFALSNFETHVQSAHIIPSHK